jgi:signal transduction histidine kinase
LLERAQVIAVAQQREDRRMLLLGPSQPVSDAIVMTDIRQDSFWQRLSETLGTFTAPQGRTVVLVGPPPAGTEAGFLEILVPEAPLKRELAAFSLRILALSLFISLLTAGLVYVALLLAVVRPVRRLTSTIERFQANPEAPEFAMAAQQASADTRTKRFRDDEIGRAERALHTMQTQVRDALRTRERLANLGQAVAKINHDLRNSLAAARLIGDSLAQSADERVQRAAPRLERALNRAIGLTEASLAYGRASPLQPVLHRQLLAPLIADAVEEGLAGLEGVRRDIDVPDSLSARVDADSLHRVLVNLVRNAGQAMIEANGTLILSIKTEMTTPELVLIAIQDSGLGLPVSVRKRLFQPFSSAKIGGTGLGLAIALELARDMGGDLRLRETTASGTCFELILQAG